MAAIVGLRSLKERCQVTIFTDSQYLADAVTKGWAKRWRANGWKRNQKDRAVNPDLWAELLDLLDRHEVTFQWVRGHAGNPENERCDEMSVRESQRKDLPVDEEYERSQG